MSILIRKKSKFKQLFCKHDYQKGTLAPAKGPVFFHLGGDEIYNICVKCGKVKSSWFRPNADGS